MLSLSTPLIFCIVVIMLVTTTQISTVQSQDAYATKQMNKTTDVNLVHFQTTNEYKEKARIIFELFWFLLHEIGNIVSLLFGMYTMVKMLNLLYTVIRAGIIAQR